MNPNTALAESECGLLLQVAPVERVLLARLRQRPRYKRLGDARPLRGVVHLGACRLHAFEHVRVGDCHSDTIEDKDRRLVDFLYLFRRKELRLHGVISLTWGR